MSVGFGILGPVAHRGGGKQPDVGTRVQRTGLVGREAELAVWARVRAAVPAAEAATVLVAGPAGVGKTALLDELVRGVDGSWHVLRATGDPVRSDSPLQVLRQWFGRLVQGSPRGEAPFDGPAQRVHDVVTGAAARVDRPGDLAFPVTWALRALAEEAPVLALVDDVQWTDPASVELLGSLARLLGQDRVALVVGLREGDAEAGTDGALLDLRGVATATVRPAPLAEEDLQSWVETELGAVPAGMVARVHHLTGGLPFLVREVVEAVRDQGWGEGADAPSLPPHALDLVARRMDLLDERQATVLAAVVVLADQAYPELVQRVARVSAEEVEAAERLLVARRLAERVDGRLRVVHPLVAEAVLATAAPGRITRLHREAAQVLDELGAVEEVVAPHLARTEPSSDPRVAERLVAAAERALDRGAPATARALARRAAVEGDVTTELQRRLLVAAGTAAQRLGDAEGAIARWEAARALEDSPIGQAHRLVDIGDLLYAVGRHEEARDTYRRAVELIDTASAEEESRSERRVLVSRLASVRWIIGEVERLSHEELDAVLAQPPEQDGIAERALLAHASLEAAVQGEDRDRCAALAVRALGDGALLVEDGVDGHALYLATLGLNAAELDDEALRILDDAVSDARVRGSLHGFATATYCRGFVHHNRGRLRLAQGDLEAALAMQEHGWRSYASIAQALLTEVHVATGETELALEVAGTTAVGEEEPALMRSAALRARGAAAEAAGDLGAAFDHFLAATELVEEYAPGPAWNPCTLGAIRTAAALRRWGVAHDLARTVERRARRFGAPRSTGRTLRSVARTRERAEAEALLREAATLLRAGDGRYELALALTDLAELLAPPGAGPHTGPRRDEAVTVAREGVAWAVRIGARPTADRAVAVLRACGVDPTASPAPAAARLTPSELRVCRLAAQGLTNRQIAEHLFVTVKAVEWHLSHAYPKLGVTSRAGLAAVLGDDLLDDGHA